MKMLKVILVAAMLTVMLSGCGECNHQWLPADCQTPKTCYHCGLTEGEPNDKHLWEDATTERPKTCSVCGKTEGDIIDADERFTTAACKDLFGNWQAKYEIPADRLSMADLTMQMRITYTFYNDGEVRIEVEVMNVSNLTGQVAQRLSQIMYDQYSQQGMTQAQADAACMELHGQTVQAFCQQRAKTVVDVMDSVEEKVYYVEDGVLYIGDDWGSGFQSYEFRMDENGKMEMDDEQLEQTLEFVRMATATK